MKCQPCRGVGSFPAYTDLNGNRARASICGFCGGTGESADDDESAYAGDEPVSPEWASDGPKTVQIPAISMADLVKGKG